MILESIVTTVDSQGSVNIAPMGPIVEWDLTTTDPIDQTFLLRPFQSSQTYRNLKETPYAVIHVTDDADLIARAAVDAITAEQTRQSVERLEQSDWYILRDCHRYFAVTVESIDDNEQRTEVVARVKQSKIVRPFFGFNRAKHAVIEAAILATRTHLIDEVEIQLQLQQLQPLIDKTGGAVEIAAFEFLKQTIDARFCKR